MTRSPKKRRCERSCLRGSPFRAVLSVSMTKKHIALISTGGTIEKVYDELRGMLVNEVSNLDVMLTRLETRGLWLTRVPLMNKDSMAMTGDDHELIAKTAEVMSVAHDGVVIVHGTDRLQYTGDRLVEILPAPKVPIVLTGAMRPYQLRNSDAMQNLTEALMAVQLAPPGIHLAMHNRLLTFPGVIKDRAKMTFVNAEELD